MAITTARIQALATAAGEAGDTLMVAICNRACGFEFAVYELPLTDAERARLNTEWPDEDSARAECEAVIGDDE